MTPTSRSVGLLVALAALALGCADDGRALREPVFDPPQPVASSIEPSVAAPPPSTSAAPSSAPVTDARLIIVDRLFSPENATAEIDGSGTMTMFWASGRWEPRTFSPIPPPSTSQLAEIAALADIS
ncbi:MAG: hypothetical protein ABIP17_02150 [Ilumatobacteraceae bacterium]